MPAPGGTEVPMPDTGETHFPCMCAYFLVDVNPDELEGAVPVTYVPAVCASGCLTRESSFEQEGGFKMSSGPWTACTDVVQNALKGLSAGEG